MKTTGIVLLVAGLLLTIYTSFSFFTKEKVIDIGELEVTADKEHKLNWSPIVGIIIMVVGGVITWQGSKKS